MSEGDYDVNLPFVFVDATNTVRARFGSREDAQYWLGPVNLGERIVDTSPQPKIPEDAEYLIWVRDGDIQMAYRSQGDEWCSSNEWWVQGELEEFLEDAKVTVLVRKEDS